MKPTKTPNTEKQAMYSHVKFSVMDAFHSLNGTLSLSTMQKTMNSHINAKDVNVTTGLQLIVPRYGILN